MFPLRLFSHRLVRAEEQFEGMENEAITVNNRLSTRESSCKVDESTRVQNTDVTLVEDDMETDSDVEEVEEIGITKNTCKNCQHKRCMLDRNIVKVKNIVVSACDRVPVAADKFANAIEEKGDAVTRSMGHLNATQHKVAADFARVNAAVAILESSINNEQNAKAEMDIEALRSEIQRRANTHAATNGVAVTVGRKRKMIEEGPISEVVVNGGERIERSHARKLSKISNRLPTRHATPSQFAR